MSQGDAQLQLAVLTVGKLIDYDIELVLQSNPMGNLGDVSALVPKFLPGTKQRGGDSGLFFPRVPRSQKKILLDGQLPEKVRGLIGSAQLGVNSFPDGLMGDVFAEEQNPALVQRELTGDQIKKGRLAGPIGPDQCAAFPRRDGEVDLIDRNDPAEGLGYPFQHESLHLIEPYGDSFFSVAVEISPASLCSSPVCRRSPSRSIFRSP